MIERGARRIGACAALAAVLSASALLACDAQPASGAAETPFPVVELPAPVAGRRNLPPAPGAAPPVPAASAAAPDSRPDGASDYKN